MMKKPTSATLLVLIGALFILAFPGFRSGRAEAGQNRAPEAPADLTVRYMFSGVTDDGLKGNNGKKATSILCTNTGNVNNTIQVKLYQYNGVNIHSTSLTASPLNSYTFSTQPTAIYFDDAIFGAGGADAIYQGFAQILSDNPSIVCTAQVLDPWGYPPAFVSAVELVQP